MSKTQNNITNNNNNNNNTKQNNKTKYCVFDLLEGLRGRLKRFQLPSPY
jgi:hypothetical protein